MDKGGGRKEVGEDGKRGRGRKEGGEDGKEEGRRREEGGRGKWVKVGGRRENLFTNFKEKYHGRRPVQMYMYMQIHVRVLVHVCMNNQ